MKRFLAIALGAMGLFAAGWVVGRRQEAPPSVSMVPANEPAAGQVEALLPQPAMVATSLDRSFQKPVAESDPMPDVWSEISELKGLRRLRLLAAVRENRSEFEVPRMLTPNDSVGDGGAELSEAFCAAFELSEGERAQLQGALGEARQAIAIEEAKHATGEITEAGTVLKVAVPAFPEAGAAIYDRLREQFNGVMGGERQALFDSAYGRTFDNLYNGMGTKARELDLMLLPAAVGSGGNQFFKIQDKWITAEGQGYSTSVLPWEKVVRKMGLLSRFLPPTEPVAAPKPPGG